MIAVHVEGNPWLILGTPEHTTDGPHGKGKGESSVDTRMDFGGIRALVAMREAFPLSASPNLHPTF